MDDRQRAAFIVAAAGIGSRLFRCSNRSLSDFLDCQSSESDLCLIATNILDYFCMEEGRFNGFMPGVRLAIGFLEKTMSGPEDQQQRQRCYADLKAVLAEGKLEPLVQWARANYH